MTNLRELKTDNGVSDWIEINPKGGDEYMVIDGVKYREVKRKAAVGEGIKITQGFGSGGEYRNGDVLVVSHATGFGNSADAVRAVGISCGIFDSEYVVLEPISEYPRIDIAASDSLAASDVDLIVLQRELNGLKRQQAEVKTQVADLDVQIDGLTDAFAKLAAKSVVPKVKAVIPPQVLRDDIVAQAKLDVAELSTTAICDDVVPTIDGDVEAFYPGDTDYVEFIVNRDKRTVVALIRYAGDNDVWAKGIAKAAPGDVFNTSIGRAISLRRALGLEVPTEYTNAPQPEDVRVGDIVEYVYPGEPRETSVVTNVRPNGDVEIDSYEDKAGDEVVAYCKGAFRINDDSDRYESEVSA